MVKFTLINCLQANMKKLLLFLSIIIVSSLACIQLLIIPHFESNIRNPTEKWALEFLISGSKRIKLWGRHSQI